MEKLKTSLESQLQLMDRYNLTAEEYLVIELLFTSIESKSVENISAYYHLPINKTGIRDILVSLRDKGVILKSFVIPAKGASLDVDTIDFNENFMKVYRKASGELGEEFFKAYPNEAVIQGQSVALKNWAKKFKSEDEMYFQYGKAIGWNPKKHAHVLELIEWSKNHDLFGLNMNIADFIVSRMWESIEAHKDGSGAINFDNLTAI